MRNEGCATATIVSQSTAAEGLPSTTFRQLLFIMIYDFGDGRERYLDDLAISPLNLDARCRQCLRRFHAANDTANAVTVARDDLDIIFAVERPQGCEGFSNFH